MEFYHDYSVLGLSVPQRGGIYGPNQRAKAPIITAYLLFALGKLKVRGASSIKVCELFCADAYYSFIASRFGADSCDAFDNDRDGHTAEARHIRDLLGDQRVNIQNQDVLDIPDNYRASIVINTGGLYHVTNPLTVLEKSYRLATNYLIVQSVVTLATERADYFETPAPGWIWGCRFTHEFLIQAIRDRGYKIIDFERNILTGNTRAEDRGSSYFLIECQGNA